MLLELQANQNEIESERAEEPSPLSFLFEDFVAPPKTAKLLANLVGGCSVLDLVLFPPEKYNILTASKLNLSSCSRDDDPVLLKVKILEHCGSSSMGVISRRNSYKILSSTESGESLTLVFLAGKSYSWRYLFPEGLEVYISGKVAKMPRSSEFSMLHPGIVSRDKVSRGGMVVNPKYALSAGLNQYNVTNAMQANIEKLNLIQDWNFLPGRLPSIQDSVNGIHLPVTTEHIKKARERLAFDELLARNLARDIAKSQKAKLLAIHINTSKRLIEEAKKLLPFQLTDDQSNVLSDIVLDQSSDSSDARLLQGNVGSGKSVVILLSALNAVEGGYQVAVMAPTFILAKQLYNDFKVICEKLGVRIVFLSGKSKGQKDIKKRIAEGFAQIAVGTHALFSDDVKFKNLGFVAVDEQHRFGIKSRIALLNKGVGTKNLFVSATPIPRTLSMALYGNIRMSVIKSKPPYQKPIITTIINIRQILDIVERIVVRISHGERVYWICPAIEDGESQACASITSRYEYLKKYFDEESISVVHGKVKEKDRELEMEKFIAGERKIMLATTVIEVGVNVPAATVIIIEEAERFGLSTLHQLRGRVGRGEKQSYCVLLFKQYTEQVMKRLSVIKKSTDGFYIAEQDMLQRGGGALLGDSQSGFENFKFFRPYEDMGVAEMVGQVERDIKLDRDRYSDQVDRLLDFFKYKQYLSYINK